MAAPNSQDNPTMMLPDQSTMDREGTPPPDIILEDTPSSSQSRSPFAATPKRPSIQATTPSTNGKKIKLAHSNVHNEFDESKTEGGKWKSKCLHCSTVYSHKNSSQLFIHLENKHPQIFEKVVSEDERNRQDIAKKNLDMESSDLSCLSDKQTLMGTLLQQLELIEGYQSCPKKNRA